MVAALLEGARTASGKAARRRTEVDWAREVAERSAETMPGVASTLLRRSALQMVRGGEVAAVAREKMVLRVRGRLLRRRCRID